MFRFILPLCLLLSYLAADCWNQHFNAARCCHKGWGTTGDPSCWDGQYAYAACCGASEKLFSPDVAKSKAWCWSGEFTGEACCNLSSGPIGYDKCWDSMHTFESCCPVPEPDEHFLRLDLADGFNFSHSRKPSRNPHMFMQEVVVVTAVDFIRHLAHTAHRFGIPLRLLDVGGNSGKWQEGQLAGLTMYKSLDITAYAPTGRPTTSHVIVGNVMKHNLNIADGSYDIVTAFSVFEHVLAPWVAALEIVRWVRNLGFIIIVVPFSWRYHAYPLDVMRFTHTGLRYLFESNGDVRTLHTGYAHVETIRKGFHADRTDEPPDDEPQSNLELIWIGQKINGERFDLGSLDTGGGFLDPIAQLMPNPSVSQKLP